MVIHVQQILIQTLTGTDKVFQNEQENRKCILKENSKISNLFRLARSYFKGYVCKYFAIKSY